MLRWLHRTSSLILYGHMSIRARPAAVFLDQWDRPCCQSVAKGPANAVAVPHIADMLGDTGTVAD